MAMLFVLSTKVLENYTQNHVNYLETKKMLNTLMSPSAELNFSGNSFLHFPSIYTSSNQRLWECVRCRINVYPDTLNDFPSWLSTFKNQPFFINNRGFTERHFSDKVHASLMIEDCVGWRRHFRRLTSLIGLKNLHQLLNFVLNIVTLTCNV